MTDKEKFRKEVEKLKSNLIYGACSSQIAMETRCKEEAYNEVLSILNTMQEEPVSIWHRGDEFKDVHYTRIYRKVVGNAENKRFEIGDILEVEDGAIDILNKDGSIVMCIRQDDSWAYIDDILKLFNAGRIVKNWKEPVSEKLEQDIDTYLATYFGGEKEKQEWPFLKKMAIHFAEWQKAQMMKDSTEVTVHIEAGNYPYIPQMELYDYDKDVPLAKEGDRYKVILIKEG